MFTLRSEIERCWAHRYLFVAYCAKSLLIVLFVLQMGLNNSDVMWVLVPMFVMSAMPVYRQYFETNLIALMLRHEDNCAQQLQLMFLMLSLFLNLPQALMFAVLTKGKGFWLSYWFALDVIGFLFHSVHSLSNQQTGIILRYLLMMPLAYPWVIFGLMSVENHIMAFKLLWLAWVSIFSLGSFFFIMCFNIGYQS